MRIFLGSGYKAVHRGWGYEWRQSRELSGADCRVRRPLLFCDAPGRLRGGPFGRYTQRRRTWARNDLLSLAHAGDRPPCQKAKTTIIVVIVIITLVEEEKEEEGRVMNGRPESGSSRTSSDAAKTKWSPPSPNRTDGIRRVGYLLPFYLSPILLEGSKEPVLSLALTLMLLSAVEQRTDLVPRLSLTLCARFGLRRRTLFAFVCSVAFLGATMASGAALALPLMWITDRVLEFLHVEQLDRALLLQVTHITCPTMTPSYVRVFLGSALPIVRVISRQKVRFPGLQTPSSDRRPSRRSLDSLSAPSVRDAEALLTQLSTVMTRIEQRAPRHRRRKSSFAAPTTATVSEVRPNAPPSSVADDSRKMAPRSSSLAGTAADGYVLKQVTVPGALSHRDHSPGGLTAWATMLIGNTEKPARQGAAVSPPQGQDAIAASKRRTGGVSINESTRAEHGVPKPTENTATAQNPIKEQSGHASDGSSTTSQYSTAPSSAPRRASWSSVGKGSQRQTNRRLSIVDFKEASASEATPENAAEAAITAAGSPTRESATRATVNTFMPPMRKPPWAQRLLLEAELGAARGRKDSSLDSLCSTLAHASSIGQYQAMLDIQRRKEAVDRKHVAIRSAFLLAVAIVTALGNIVSLARLPTRKMLTKQLTRCESDFCLFWRLCHGSRDEMLLSAGPMGQLQWTLVAIPGSVVAFLVSCCYFYARNLSP
ncbi:hypothetical protein HPB49_017964 [Dermacentor silvarum]|uniref:Uncharacterized protein n=1 Tax=Dermacentor silvarum TaxID=543639 RepID=A0ACB8D728_DERSI|nr:hypothetical protein HPB49_017964 [Dermacentor silvarum]